MIQYSQLSTWVIELKIHSLHYFSAETLQQASLDETPQEARGNIPGGPVLLSYLDRDDIREADNEVPLTCS